MEFIGSILPWLLGIGAVVAIGGIALVSSGKLNEWLSTLAATGRQEMQRQRGGGDNAQEQRQDASSEYLEHRDNGHTVVVKRNMAMAPVGGYTMGGVQHPAVETIVVQRDAHPQYTVRGHVVANQGQYRVDSITDANGHTWTPEQPFVIDLLTGNQLRFDQLEAEWTRRRQGGQQQQPTAPGRSVTRPQERLSGTSFDGYALGNAGNGNAPNNGALGENHHLINIDQNGYTSWLRVRLVQRGTDEEQAGHVYLHGHRVDQNGRISPSGNRFRLEEVVFRNEEGAAIPVRVRGTIDLPLTANGEIDVNAPGMRSRLGGIIANVYAGSTNARLVAISSPNRVEIQDAGRALASLVSGGQNVQDRPQGLPSTPDATFGSGDLSVI